MRTLAKTISWRFFATIISFSLVYGVTGDWKISTTVGLLDCLVKMVVYYVHEILWTEKQQDEGR